MAAARGLEIRDGLHREYSDVLTPAALATLSTLAPFNRERRALMATRMHRRLERARDAKRIDFLDPALIIPRTQIRVQDARAGNFEEIAPLSCDWR